jgi:hypothetical protein
MLKQKQNIKTNFSADKNYNDKTGNSGKIWKFLSRFSVLAVIVLGVSFIISVNSLSVRGFVLQELKNKTKILETESNNIELNIMSMETYENINQRAQNMKMVKIDKIDYVMSGAVGVAKK